ATIPIDAVGGEDWQAIGRRVVSGSPCEEPVVMVKHFLEGCGWVVVEVRGSLADPPEIRYVHHTQVCHLPGQEQAPWIGSGEGCHRAVPKCDLVLACISFEARRAWRKV